MNKFSNMLHLKRPGEADIRVGLYDPTEGFTSVFFEGVLKVNECIKKTQEFYPKATILHVAIKQGGKIKYNSILQGIGL